MTPKLLDTDICIDVLRGAPDVVERLAAELAEGDVAISAITAFELVWGAQNSPRAVEELAKVQRFLAGGPPTIPFDQTDAETAGRIRASLARRGRMIGAYDLLIAGQGLARGRIVVTANTREFARVGGLRLEDWRAAPAAPPPHS